MLAEIVTLDPNLAVAIDALKLDVDQLSFGSKRNREGLAIPTQATGQCAAACAGGSILTKLAFDTEIVGQIQLPPLRIVQSPVLSVRDVAEMKAPVFIEGNSFPGARISEADGRYAQ